MQCLWKAVEEENLTREQLQQELEKISNWIKECEMNKPHFKAYY